MDNRDAVRRQFGPVAEAYAVSRIHVSGDDLVAMLDAADLHGTQRVLDVASGAGHTALAFAPRVASVVALDLTETMLATGRRVAAENGIANVTFIQGDAEQLPFPDAAFDIVTCRYAAHHFPQPLIVAREWSRVLAPSGMVLLVDFVAPDDPASDTVLNTADLLRDPSHVRDHSAGQWSAFLEAAGFAGVAACLWPVRVDFAAYIERMQTPAAAAAAIRALFENVPASVR